LTAVLLYIKRWVVLQLIAYIEYNVQCEGIENILRDGSKGVPEIESPTGGRLVGSVAEGEIFFCTLQSLVVEVRSYLEVDDFFVVGISI